MIDLKSAYIKNEEGELMTLFIGECKKQGIEIMSDSARKGWTYFGVVDGSICGINSPRECAIEVSLADLKPRVKVEYIKFTGSFSVLAKLFEDGEYLYTAECGTHTSKNMHNLLSLHEGTGIYREVEREITWQDEVEPYGITDDCGDVKFDHMLDSDEFINVCHIVASMTDNKPT